MNIEKTLFLECRGCYFWNDDPIAKISDVGNYRIGVYNNRITAHNGRQYCIELGTYTKYNYRKHNKISGKPLKYYKKEIILENALHVSTEFEDNNGCWADLTLEKEIHNKLLTYTRKDILKLFNEISIKQFDKIVLIESEKLIPELNSIYNMGGYREKNILDNLTDVKTVIYNNEYWVLKFIDNLNNCFEYEYFSKRITN